jgi:hypothetical protein
MITDHKDFLEQLNVIKQGIKIPAYDISKIMDSEEYNNYYADIEKSLNDLTGMIRSLEDCNQYMVTYVNDIVDKKYKELSDKLIALENNYSLYQNKNFISYSPDFDDTKVVYDRDGTQISQVDYVVQQEGKIDLFKNISSTKAYSVNIDKDHGSAVISFERNMITELNKKTATFMIKLSEPIMLNYISCDLVNCTGSFTINNSINQYSFNSYFDPQEISLIVITLNSSNPEVKQKKVLYAKSKGFMDNAYAGIAYFDKGSEKTEEQRMAKIYYENDVTKYIGEANGRRNKDKSISNR